jgi:hypothetical protein
VATEVTAADEVTPTAVLDAAADEPVMSAVPFVAEAVADEPESVVIPVAETFPVVRDT